MTDDSVSTCTLGFVQGLVGLRDQLVKIFRAHLVIFSRNPNTDRKMKRILTRGDKRVLYQLS